MAPRPRSERVGPHADHTSGVLSITEPTSDGGELHQSWEMCGCTLNQLRETLGIPDHQLLATAEQAQATGRAVDSIPGITHLTP
ncbi:hypothetical protein [Nonomuraea sp. NPDC052265]|uniref:hypothetical protein n=1 Tax=Nonomuraea sp. NPDC052265 TaxID=3364374 RepID=UPI0037C62DBE